MKEKTDLEILEEWFEKEKANGLVDIKFSGNWTSPFPQYRLGPKPTIEQVAKEINEMNALIEAGDFVELKCDSELGLTVEQIKRIRSVEI